MSRARTEFDYASLTSNERRRHEAIFAAESLSDLLELTHTETAADAYIAAKREWSALQSRALPAARTAMGIPGTLVEMGTHDVWVHGITHADTDAERQYLRTRVPSLLDAGAAIRCEQGIRSMYFDSDPAICEMDDYAWAMSECSDLEDESHLVANPTTSRTDLRAEVESIGTRVRRTLYSLIGTGRTIYGEDVEKSLGTVTASLLSTAGDLATGAGYESFRTSARAGRDPNQLAALQRHYERFFLPQPVEREWVRELDPALELLTHARNERMADSVVYHHESTSPVHLFVGAAHQPGVAYYLRRHRDGYRTAADFEPVG